MATLLALSVAGCANHPPSTAVATSAAERSFGSFNATSSLATIVKERDIKPLDPGSSAPLFRQLQTELQKTDPQRRYRGITYSLTSANALDTDWIVQSPGRWARSAIDVPFIALNCESCLPDIALPQCRTDADCTGGAACRPLAAAALPGGRQRRVCVGHSDLLLDRFYKLMVLARQTIDITALQPPPDGRFLAALRNAVTMLARSGRQVSIRVLVGQYPLEGGTDAKALLGELMRDARAIPGSRLSIYVGAIRSCTGDSDCKSFTWNHAKILAVDGQSALVGGHNLWSRHYLLDLPVHDLSMQVRGPAAADASQFAGALWQYVCTHKNGDEAVRVASWLPGGAGIGEECLAELRLPPLHAAGNVAVMAVGRLGAGITDDFANQNDLARDLMMSAGRRTILIAQQDLAFTLGQPTPLYAESTLERLAEFMLAHKGEVFIVLSNPGSMSRDGVDYSNGVPLETVAWKIREVARKRSQLSDEALNESLCRQLHLAPFRFGPDATWPDGKPIANHSKFWMIDDRYFYIGSDNLYPVNLQEFGYIVDSRAGARQLRRDYWDKLWQWSRRAAISGLNGPRCIFTEKPKPPPRVLVVR